MSFQCHSYHGDGSTMLLGWFSVTINTKKLRKKKNFFFKKTEYFWVKIITHGGLAWTRKEPGLIPAQHFAVFCLLIVCLEAVIFLTTISNESKYLSKRVFFCTRVNNQEYQQESERKLSQKHVSFCFDFTHIDVVFECSNAQRPISVQLFINKVAWE